MIFNRIKFGFTGSLREAYSAFFFLSSQWIKSSLEQALSDHAPEIHHSDQGVQYAASAYTARLQEAGVHISMAEVGAAWQNGYAERLMRTIKEEECHLTGYLTCLPNNVLRGQALSADRLCRISWRAW